MAGKGNGSAEGQKDKAIELAVSTIEKQFGKGAILKMTEDAIDREVDSIPTGSVSLALALGIGGYPRGRVVEVYGPEKELLTSLKIDAPELEVESATDDDRFVGLLHSAGISEIRIFSVDGNLQIDHVQYGGSTADEK